MCDQAYIMLTYLSPQTSKRRPYYIYIFNTYRGHSYVYQYPSCFENFIVCSECAIMAISYNIKNSGVLDYLRANRNKILLERYFTGIVYSGGKGCDVLGSFPADFIGYFFSNLVVPLYLT